jgi:hypothetical protein
MPFTLILLALMMAAGTARADALKVTEVANPAQVKAIVSSISAFEKGQMVATDQIVNVTTLSSSFLVVPATYVADKAGGCHLYLLSQRYQLNDKIALWVNDDSFACDAVLSVFGCKLAPTSGIVVMVGLRGGERRQPQSLFLEAAGNGGLAQNVGLTRQLAGAESAFQARQRLGCLK